jgi:hypothetical protein
MENDNKGVAITPPVEHTCANCKHWGRGFNADSELLSIQDSTWRKLTGPEIIEQLRLRMRSYPLRREDKCQRKENDKEEKHTVYIGVFTTVTDVFQRPTTKDWYCPLWEKLEQVKPEVKLRFDQWLELKTPKDTKIHDVTLEGCKLAGNRYLWVDTRRDRVNFLMRWYGSRMDEETFDKILSECKIAEKKKGWW